MFERSKLISALLGIGLLAQPCLKPGCSWTDRCELVSWQQLKMPMGLAGSCQRATVEEPQPCRVLINTLHGLPVLFVQPTRLRCPLPCDQQHVTPLHGIFVENQHVTPANAFDFQVWIPWSEWIGFRSGWLQMAGQAALKTPAFELRGPGSQAHDLRFQWFECTALLGFITTAKSCFPKSLLSHQP